MTAGSPRLFPTPQDQLSSDDYYTPAWVFERMGIRFDLDVCAPPGGVPWIPADRYFTQEDDGLAQPWHGRVWMNPPYSDAAPWVLRFIEHGEGIALVPMAKARWCRQLWAVAHGITISASETSDGMTFVSPSGPSSFRPINPIFFFAFGDECVDAISRLGVVRRIA